MKDTIWIKKGRFTPLAILLMLALPLTTSVICLCFGRMNVPVGEVLTALRTALTGGSAANVQNYSIVINLRLPRILMAIIGKKSTGMGTFVSTSLFASGIWCNAIGVVSHQPQFGGERPNDPLRPADPFCHFYECSDGKWIGVFDNEYRRELPKFANLFGMPEIADDPRAASLESLHETDFVVEIVTRLNAIFKTRPVAEWEAFLSENNVSCERMRTIRDVSTDEQAIANGYIQKVTFKDDLEVMMPCPPMQLTEYAMRPYTSAGRLGADTDSIFRDLGYTDPEIAAMKASGAIQ